MARACDAWRSCIICLYPDRHANTRKTPGCPAVLANGVTMVLGGFLSLNAAILVEIPGLGKFAFLVVYCFTDRNQQLICSNLQANLLKHYSPTFMAFAGFLTPLCAAFYGWLLLNERLCPQYLVSFLCVFLGLFIYYFDETKRKRKLAKTMVLDSKEF